MKKCIPILLLGVALTAATLPAQAQDAVPVAPLSVEQSQDLTTIAQDFVDNLVAGDYSAALQMYDPAVRTSITTDTLRQGWEEAVTANGAFEGIVNVETQALAESADGSYIAIVTTEFENGTVDFLVNFTGQNQIVSIFPLAE
jgi:limonene-1,2-epoxide hydrolase